MAGVAVASCWCISGIDERNRSWQSAGVSGMAAIRKWSGLKLESSCKSRRHSVRIVRAAIADMQEQAEERRDQNVAVDNRPKIISSSATTMPPEEVALGSPASTMPVEEDAEADVDIDVVDVDAVWGDAPGGSVVTTPPENNVSSVQEELMEKVFLVGVELKRKRTLFGIHESLNELGQLADTAGLLVVGSAYQKLDNPNPRTYIASGKVEEVKAAVRALDADTVIFDDEVSPRQLRNLEKAFGNVRVCDRTALIIDIFSQRAATREAALQVELAQMEYQLPRLTKLWSHLERQAGGMVKGMGEKQIEVDKRILRDQITGLKKHLESVREHRQQYRDRRASVPIPVISLVGYTNAGKSTFLNRLSDAGVLAEDKLFATLDPVTRRVQLPNGKECLFTDTVGFIQKLPTQLVAAFRATLEEISDSSLILHMIDISHPMASEQTKAVDDVLAELNVRDIPQLCIWNKIDRAKYPEKLRAEAKEKGVICLSALTGEGMKEFYEAVEEKLKDLLVQVEAVVPYDKGDLVDMIHRRGVVEHEEYTPTGTLVKAHVPLELSKQLLEYR